jgi:O-antigen ligase
MILHASSDRFAWTAFAVVLAGVLTAWADPVAGHLCNAAALILAAAWLFRHGWSAGLHWMALPLAAVPVWGFVQLAMGWSAYAYVTRMEAFAWVANSAFCFLAFATLQERARRDQVLTVLLCCAVALSALGMLQWFTAGGRVFWVFSTPYESEVMGPFLNRDHYAVFVELVLPIALSRALLESVGAARYSLAAGFLFASVVTTGSRAGTAMITLETILLVVLSRRRVWSKTRVAVLTGAVLAISTAAGWEYLWFRFQQADLFTFRREMALATLDMIRARPWTGFGLGTWPSVYPGFARFDPPGYYMNHAHNDWLEWFADGGILLVALCLAIFAASLSLAKRNWWAFGVPVALLHAGFDFPLHKQAVAALLFFLLGAAAATLGENRPRPSPRKRGRKIRPVTLDVQLLDTGPAPSPSKVS